MSISCLSLNTCSLFENVSLRQKPEFTSGYLNPTDPAQEWEPKPVQVGDITFQIQKQLSQLTENYHALGSRVFFRCPPTAYQEHNMSSITF